MFAKEKPGTDGLAARLPKKPGIQKLTPPSSAFAAGDDNTSATARVADHPLKCLESIMLRPLLSSTLVMRLGARMRHAYPLASRKERILAACGLRITQGLP